MRTHAAQAEEAMMMGREFAHLRLLRRVEAVEEIAESVDRRRAIGLHLGDVLDRIVGLEIGADDYIPKPFEPRELLTRIQTILRRARAPAPPPQARLV